jgi:hypothetical protein
MHSFLLKKNQNKQTKQLQQKTPQWFQEMPLDTPSSDICCIRILKPSFAAFQFVCFCLFVCCCFFFYFFVVSSIFLIMMVYIEKKRRNTENWKRHAIRPLKLLLYLLYLLLIMTDRISYFTDTFNFTVRFPETKVPNKETTYMCITFELPRDKEYHLIATEPVIDNSDIMHHTLVYGCEGGQTCFMIVYFSKNIVKSGGFYSHLQLF